MVAKLFQRLALLCLIAGLSVAAVATTGNAPQWVGRGKYRILVRVDPIDIGTRTSDEMPTRIHISYEDVPVRGGLSGKIDVASLQVAQYDPTSGQPVKYGKWAFAQMDWELPYRWYDDSISEDFPEVLNGIDAKTGELRSMPVRNWGYLYETLGDWNGGNLSWLHTQKGNSTSYYAIYFDLLPLGKEPDQMPRRGFVGDGTERVIQNGPTTHGLFLGRVEIADWNGDGLRDLLVGCERGGIIWFPNRGTKKQPHFPYPKLMFTADGKPLDVGFNSVPLVFDWDGDGLQDLLSGVYPNRVIWYRNVGGVSLPKLEYKGFILADGKPLSLPYEPVPESEGIYKTDYHPVLAVADWDHDGDFDLLAGGYVTGMIYWFSNEGTGDDRLPVLKYRAPIEADGKPIDTSWCAAPTVADFDNDGDLDIISGAMTLEPTGGEVPSSEKFLYYFENKGDAKAPKLMHRPFPLKGKFPEGRAATPRAADLNGDGLLDLVVSEGRDLYQFLNVGTTRVPLWEYSPHLEVQWNSAPLAWLDRGVLPFELLDWNGDGRFDVVSRFTVQLNEGKGNPQIFGPPQRILPSDQEIFHKSARGDQWTFTHTCDLDGDGKLDILYGVHEGHIYFHRNLSSATEKRFDTKGVLLNTTDGNPIKVGIHSGKWDFDVLQGARTTVVGGDFDRDGRMDLVVGDTYGKMRHYRNLSGGPNPTFALPEIVTQLDMRFVPSVADWNGDDWPDLIIGSNRVFLVMNSGKRNGPRFLPAKLVNQPGPPTAGGGVLEQISGSTEWRLVESKQNPGLYLPYDLVAKAVDWNGDGDLDIMANASYGYLCWYERSFLHHGYAPATMLSLKAR